MIKITNKQASKSNFKRARVGAVICKGSRILSTGVNKVDCNDSSIPNKFKRWISSIHAEADAISKLLKKHRLKDLAGSTMYITRILSNGNMDISKPCPHCRDLIESVGIKKIVYVDIEGNVVKEKI